MLKRLFSKLFEGFRLLLILGSVAVCAAWLTSLSEENLEGMPRFVDGDNLFLNGQEIRLFGIDAPEYTQQCHEKNNGTPVNCGRLALQFVKGLIGKNKIDCEGWERDKYERLLAVCSVGEMELNREMVVNGWAVSFGDYGAEEAIAKRNSRGMWSRSFKLPSQWRKDQREMHDSSWIRQLKFW